MNINFYLDHRVNKKNIAGIYCYIRGIKNISKIQIFTGFRIDSKHWNSEKQEVRRSLIGYDAINTTLERIKSEIYSLFASTTQNDKVFTKDEFIDLFRSAIEPKTEVLSRSFMSVFDEYIQNKKDNNQIDAAKKFETLKKHLIKFQKKENLELNFETFDFSVSDKLTKYFLNTAKFTNNTVNKTFLNINVFMNWASERGYNAKMDYKKMKFKESKTEVIYLTSEELQKLIDYDLSENLRLIKVRDIFLLCCFTGVRYSDISKLTKDAIVAGVWHLRTEKTKDILYIPILDLANNILKKYFDNNLQLPVISNQKTNKYIKELCKLAGIDSITNKFRYRGSTKIDLSQPKYELITAHTSRRTFIVLSLEKGMRPEVVMSIVGHKDYKTMQRYVKITDNIKKSEMLKAWNTLNNDLQINKLED